MGRTVVVGLVFMDFRSSPNSAHTGLEVANSVCATVSSLVPGPERPPVPGLGI